MANPLKRESAPIYPKNTDCKPSLSRVSSMPNSSQSQSLSQSSTSINTVPTSSTNQINFPLRSIQRQNVTETSKPSLQQISRTSVLIRGRSEATWNSLREIMGQEDRKTIKQFNCAGWIVLISDLPTVLKTARRRNIPLAFDSIPKFVRDIQVPFNFNAYSANLSSSLNTNTPITPTMLSSDLINNIRTYSSFQDLIDSQSTQTKKVERNLSKLPPDVLQKLFQFQKQAIEFGINLNCRLLIADEMINYRQLMIESCKGVGKTIQALCLAYIYKDQWPLLIICPSCLRLTFRQEILNWFYNHIEESSIQVINKGTDKLLKSSTIVIMSFDIVGTFKDVIEIKQFQTCIIDEAHYLKSLDSLRSINIVPLVQRIKNVILLTGTPAMAKPRELYNILTILRPDIFKEFKVFGSRYCDPKVHPIFQSISFEGCDNEQELHFLMNEGLMIRRLKAEVLPDLPEKRRKKVIVEISKSYLKELKSIISKSEQNTFMAQLQNQLESFEDLDEKTKSQLENQSNSAFKDHFNKLYITTGMAKIEALKEYLSIFLENNNKTKLIIFAHHKCVLNEIEKLISSYFSLPYIRIDGEVSLEDRVKRVNLFQKFEYTRVAILSIQAASHGITLTAASHVIFAELYPIPAVMLQAEDRSHRVNQRSEVLCHYMIGKDTIDEKIFNLLLQKFEITSNIIDGQKQSLSIHESEILQFNPNRIKSPHILAKDDSQTQGGIVSYDLHCTTKEEHQFYNSQSNNPKSDDDNKTKTKLESNLAQSLNNSIPSTNHSPYKKRITFPKLIFELDEEDLKYTDISYSEQDSISLLHPPPVAGTVETFNLINAINSTSNNYNNNNETIKQESCKAHEFLIDISNKSDGRDIDSSQELSLTQRCFDVSSQTQEQSQIQFISSLFDENSSGIERTFQINNRVNHIPESKQTIQKQPQSENSPDTQQNQQDTPTKLNAQMHQIINFINADSSSSSSNSESESDEALQELIQFSQRLSKSHSNHLLRTDTDSTSAPVISPHNTTNNNKRSRLEFQSQPFTKETLVTKSTNDAPYKIAFKRL